MCDSDDILHLYTNVLSADVKRYRLRDSEIRTGIRNMAEIYKPAPSRLRSEVLDVANYADAAHRCAYLHKYAAFHTAMVSEMLGRAFDEHPGLFHDLIFADQDWLRLCSLGAGPGNDVVGVLNMIHSKMQILPIPVSATFVDFHMQGWKQTFNSVLNELNSFDHYGMLGMNFTPGYFSWEYLQANLLDVLDNKVKEAIGTATIVTMVKFISAAACKSTFDMIKNIFNEMRPGALILFIDNAAGGFRQLINRAAYEKKFISIFGPLNHEQYINETCNVQRYGCNSCFKTTVNVHLLKKAGNNHCLLEYRIPSAKANFKKKRLLMPPLSAEGNTNASDRVDNYRKTSAAVIYDQKKIPVPSSSSCSSTNVLTCSNSYQKNLTKVIHKQKKLTIPSSLAYGNRNILGKLNNDQKTLVNNDQKRLPVFSSSAWSNRNDFGRLNDDQKKITEANLDHKKLPAVSSLANGSNDALGRLNRHQENVSAPSSSANNNRNALGKLNDYSTVSESSQGSHVDTLPQINPDAETIISPSMSSSSASSSELNESNNDQCCLCCVIS